MASSAPRQPTPRGEVSLQPIHVRGGAVTFRNPTPGASRDPVPVPSAEIADAPVAPGLTRSGRAPLYTSASAPHGARLTGVPPSGGYRGASTGLPPGAGGAAAAQQPSYVPEGAEAGAYMPYPDMGIHVPPASAEAYDSAVPGRRRRRWVWALAITLAVAAIVAIAIVAATVSKSRSSSSKASRAPVTRAAARGTPVPVPAAGAPTLVPTASAVDSTGSGSSSSGSGARWSENPDKPLADWSDPIAAPAAEAAANAALAAAAANANAAAGAGTSAGAVEGTPAVTVRLVDDSDVRAGAGTGASTEAGVRRARAGRTRTLSTRAPAQPVLDAAASPGPGSVALRAPRGDGSLVIAPSVISTRADTYPRAAAAGGRAGGGFTTGGTSPDHPLTWARGSRTPGREGGEGDDESGNWRVPTVRPNDELATPWIRRR